MTPHNLLDAAATHFKQVLIAVLLGAGFACASPTLVSPASAMPHGGIGIRSLTGAWRVVAVRVAPSPVQALSENDPSYMGAVLDVAPAQLSWRQPYKVSSLSYRCDRPGLERATLSCSNGDFGPPGSHLKRTGRRIFLDWFDGGTLILERVR